MRQYLVLLKKQLRSITREKTIMFAIIVQLFIASFSSVILVGVMAFYDPTSIGTTARVRIGVGVVGDADSRLLDYLRESRIRARVFPGRADAEASFHAGEIDAILEIPENHDGVVRAKLTLPKLDARKTVILMMLDRPLKRYENYLREAAGVEMHFSGASGRPYATYEFLYSIIIPILMLLPALIAGSIVIDSLSEEFEQKTFDTLMSAPVSLTQVLASKLSAAVLTAIIQVVAWVGLLRLNGITVEQPVLVVLLAAILSALIAVGTAFVALCFRDRERAQFVYSMALVALVGGGYLFDASPVRLLTRLATGDPQTGIAQVALYAVLLGVSGILFFNLTGRARARAV